MLEGLLLLEPSLGQELLPAFGILQARRPNQSPDMRPNRLGQSVEILTHYD
jgi:hypothetical protein